MILYSPCTAALKYKGTGDARNHCLVPATRATPRQAAGAGPTGLCKVFQTPAHQEIPCGSGLTAPGLLVCGPAPATKPLLVTSTLAPGSPALGSARTLLTEPSSHHRLGPPGSWCGPEDGAPLVPSRGALLPRAGSCWHPSSSTGSLQQGFSQQDKQGLLPSAAGIKNKNIFM